MTKRIYRFGGGATEGDATMALLLGGKGAHLAEMCQLGLPVPPGVTITTEVCQAYHRADASKHGLVAGLLEELEGHLVWLADVCGQGPPLLSVRSGAPVSMPGMMDTVLNVGLTSVTLPDWVDRIGPRAAFDSYRRLIQMLGTTAYGLDPQIFAMELDLAKARHGVDRDSELDAGAMVEVAGAFKTAFEQHVVVKFPDTLEDQLRSAILAVLNSWMSPRALEYRRLNGIDPDLGTACILQAMVFGNRGETSGTGVLFTRNPLTGEPLLYGEWLPDAQGEDVVAGVRTPQPLVTMTGLGTPLLETADGHYSCWPAVHEDLAVIAGRLEQHHREMMDIEFTVEQGKLWILQCRRGKRTAEAAVRIAVDLALEGLIDREQALARVDPKEFKQVQRPRIAESFEVAPHVVGLPASPGVATGRPVFSAEDAVASDEPCILITRETVPEDLAGMAAAAGVLTATGGATSHAAVVSRAMNKPCVVGCTELDLDFAGWKMIDRVTIDGATGRVWVALDVPVVDAAQDPAVIRLSMWALETLGRAWQMAVPPVEMNPHQVWIMAAEWWGQSATLELVLDRLASYPSCARVVLDLTPPARFQVAADSWLVDLRPALDPAGFLMEAMQALAARRDELAGLRLVIDEAFDELRLKMAKTPGFEVLVRPQTVADVLPGGGILVDPGFIERVVGGQPAWQELLDLLAAAGRAIDPIQPAVPLSYAVFAALGKSC